MNSTHPKRQARENLAEGRHRFTERKVAATIAQDLGSRPLHRALLRASSVAASWRPEELLLPKSRPSPLHPPEPSHPLPADEETVSTRRVWTSNSHTNTSRSQPPSCVRHQSLRTTKIRAAAQSEAPRRVPPRRNAQHVDGLLKGMMALTEARCSAPRPPCPIPSRHVTPRHIT